MMAKIVVVEDNEANWDMISRRPQRRGYTVVYAADGQEAVDMAARERPDLILMDVSEHYRHGALLRGAKEVLRSTNLTNLMG